MSSLARVLIALAVTAVSCLAQASDARQARTERETIDLLATLLREQAGRLHPCALDTEWNASEPVPAEVARKHLGSRLDADLLGRWTSTQPAALLDPAGAMPQNFCTKDAADAYQDKILADFRSGDVKGETKPGDPIARLIIKRIAFARPIFDRNYKTAVVNAQFENLLWWKASDSAEFNNKIYDADGVVRRRDLHYAGITYIFRKKNGAWRIVSENVHSMGH